MSGYLGRPLDDLSALPAFTCHKRVQAARITAIHVSAPPAYEKPTCRGSYALNSACGRCERCAYERSLMQSTAPAAILLLEGPVRGVEVSTGYLAKHQPEVGGYFVLYEDGYRSFSPAGVFEAGYAPEVKP